MTGLRLGASAVSSRVAEQMIIAPYDDGGDVAATMSAKAKQRRPVSVVSSIFYAARTGAKTPIDSIV
jgi:hypothetical protein